MINAPKKTLPVVEDWLQRHEPVAADSSAIVTGCGLPDDAEALKCLLQKHQSAYYKPEYNFPKSHSRLPAIG